MLGSSVQQIKRESPEKQQKNNQKVKDLQITDFEKDQKEPVFRKQDIDVLYMAKCIDSGIPFYEEQMQKFQKYCEKESCNRKVFLNEMFLGIQTCKVLSEILLSTDRISSIIISRNRIGDEGAKIFAYVLKKTNNLAKLDISSNEISKQGTEYLADALLHNQSLVDLQLFSHDGLHSNQIGEIGAKCFSQVLAKNKILTFLNLGGNKIGNNGLSYLTLSMNPNVNNTLQSLNVSNDDITQEGCQYFLQSLVHSHLIELDMSKNQLGLKGAEQFGEVLKHNHRLIRLNLSQCQIGPKGLQDIMNGLKKNKFITHLNISRNDFKFGLPHSLSSILMVNNILQELDLSFCSLGSNMMLGVTDGLFSNSTLKKLNLRGNQIEDHPIEILGHILDNPKNKITFLDLSMNFITDFGGLALAEALHTNRSLEYLNMKLNYLQDDSAQKLIQAIRGNNLVIKKIKLDNNFISMRFIMMIDELLQENIRRQEFNKMPEYVQTILNLRIQASRIVPTRKLIDETVQVKVEAKKQLENQKYIYQSSEQEESAKTQKLIDIKELLNQQLIEIGRRIDQIENQKFLKVKELNEIESMQILKNREIIGQNYRAGIDLQELKKGLEKTQIENQKLVEQLKKDLFLLNEKEEDILFRIKGFQSRIELEKAAQQEAAKEEDNNQIMQSQSKKRKSMASNPKTPRSPTKNEDQNFQKQAAIVKRRSTLKNKK
ncbi:UNKNOWN [Stylonychia lemnae]|uniref:Leucine rich repeat family protein n=1 Tax=Stylonychia lemnae TaxID=5949 RepID=A0A078ABV6_STYLE|nr:UNKNOWN [Stylonychia lemnae]|eukprot:CDW79679.1 UNKNOWN [Stylonychia lemnae]